MNNNEKSAYDIHTIITTAITNSFTILRQLKNTGFSEKTQLIIPNYQRQKDSELCRVSEQELRFVFIEQIVPDLQKNGLYYSIETPTTKHYRFSSKTDKHLPPERDKGRCANFDLTILDGDNTLAIVEFKSKSAHPHSYAKDLCKLWYREERQGEKTLRYFINVFETMETETKEHFVHKIKDNGYFNKQEGDVDVFIVGKSLTEGQEDYEVDCIKDSELSI